MDGKKVMGGGVVPRRGTSVAQRHKCVKGDDNAQFCNRIGCNGRLNHTKATRIGCSEKVKHPTPSFRSSNGKEIIGNSSRAGADMTHGKKSLHQSQRRLSSHLETSESDTVRERPENSHSSSRSQRGIRSELIETESGKDVLTDVGSSGVSSNSRPRKMFPQKSGPGKHNTLLASSLSSASTNNRLGPSNIGSGSRYGLRNLKCNSISDVIPRGCSPSEPRSRKSIEMKKRVSEGESSSSSREKKKIGHSSDDGHVPRSTRGICISEPSGSRSWASGTETGASLVRTRRSMNVNSRFRLSNRGDGNSSSHTESTFMISQLPRPETPVNSGMHTSSYQCSPEASSSGSSSFSLSASDGNDLPGSALFTSTEIGITHFMNYDASRRYNMDGIAEVLRELERIERNEELTYEQLLALETNLFLSSLNIYDQHRDLRLDIDNMSYEELLALEERMGTVSTALSEESLSKCLKRSIYQPLFLEEGITGSGDQNDIKCSVCQEEYEVGDEVAKLECHHRFHIQCIEQWLRMKNWCPICKASAATSHSS